MDKASPSVDTLDALIADPRVCAAVSRAAKRVTLAGTEPHTDIEDIEQDILLRLVRAYRARTAPPSIGWVAWAVAETRDYAVDLIREASRRTRYNTPDEDDETESRPRLRPLPRDIPSLGDDVAATDLRLDAEHVLGGLPPTLRAVANDLLAGWRRVDIAERHGISVATVARYMRQIGDAFARAGLAREGKGE